MVDSIVDELDAGDILRLAQHISDERTVPRAIVQKVFETFSDGGMLPRNELKVGACRRNGEEFMINTDGEEVHGYGLFRDSRALVYAPLSRTGSVEIFGTDRHRIKVAAAVVRLAGRNYILPDVKYS